MHLIITDAGLARSRAVYLTGSRVFITGLFAALVLIFAGASLYHWIVRIGVDEGWPLVTALTGSMDREEVGQRERFMRENIDAMARRVGEMQAKLLQLDALGERVSGLAGIHPDEIRTLPGRGGALIPGPSLSLEQLQATLSSLEETRAKRVDLFTVMESRLMDQKLRRSMLPTAKPVSGVAMGSSFGWRIDPFNGRSALHTGLDFPGAAGTPILAAAGGVVVTQEFHAEYGNMIEVDHGNELVSRYAHASRVHVKKGDLVRRGQKIGEIGTTGRSTGPHLHFEVLVKGVQQDPGKFLRAGENLGAPQLAAAEIPSAVMLRSAR